MVAHDVAVGAWDQLGRFDLIAFAERFGRFAERPTGSQRRFVGRGHVGLLAELVLDESQRRVQRSAEQPVHQTHREEILAAIGDLRRQPVLADGVPRQLGHRHAEDAVGLLDDRRVQRVRFDLGQLEFFVGEPVLVGDQDAALTQVAEVGDHRRRVHHDQRVERIAGRENLFAGELDLEPGHAGPRAPRCPDLGGEVRKGRDVVAGQRAGVGQLRAEQLHAVAAVPGQPDGDAGDGFDVLIDGFGRGGGGRHGVAGEGSLVRGDADAGPARRGFDRSSRRHVHTPMNGIGTSDCAGCVDFDKPRSLSGQTVGR